MALAIGTTVGGGTRAPKPRRPASPARGLAEFVTATAPVQEVFQPQIRGLSFPNQYEAGQSTGGSRFLQGVANAFNPRNMPASVMGMVNAIGNRENAYEPVGFEDLIYGGIGGGARNAQAASRDPETAGELFGGILGLPLGLRGGGALGAAGRRTAASRRGGTATRARNYPGRTNMDRLTVRARGVGGHGGFGSRLGDPARRLQDAEDAALVEHQRLLNAMYEAERNRRGVPPAVDRLLNRPEEQASQYQAIFDSRNRASEGPAGRQAMAEGEYYVPEDQLERMRDITNEFTEPDYDTGGRFDPDAGLDEGPPDNWNPAYAAIERAKRSPQNMRRRDRAQAPQSVNELFGGRLQGLFAEGKKANVGGQGTRRTPAMNQLLEQLLRSQGGFRGLWGDL